MASILTISGSNRSLETGTEHYNPEIGFQWETGPLDTFLGAVTVGMPRLMLFKVRNEVVDEERTLFMLSRVSPRL